MTKLVSSHVYLLRRLEAAVPRRPQTMPSRQYRLYGTWDAGGGRWGDSLRQHVAAAAVADAALVRLRRAGVASMTGTPSAAAGAASAAAGVGGSATAAVVVAADVDTGAGVDADSGEAAGAGA